MKSPNEHIGYYFQSIYFFGTLTPLSQSFLNFLIRILYNISDILVNDEKDKLFHQLLSTKK